MFNFKNPVFSKLYRYYCAKLLTRIWTSLLYFLIFLLYLALFWKSSFFEGRNSWTQKLTLFWLISIIQLGALWFIIHPLINYLAGRESGWRQLRQKQLFGLPKISKQNDVGVLLYTPGLNRPTIIFAKFAAIFTYFMVLNFFLCALLAVFFLAATNLGAIATFSFLLLNGLFFGLVNFSFLAPFLFYQAEAGSWWVYLLIFAFIIFLQLVFYFLWEFIIQYPLVFCSLSIPFFLLAGYCFFSLYRKKILTQDLA